ncbi:hypothetical protein [Lactobacillus helveticus]|uniref:hypothetical protein n=1 Tax=Lactobacillus helveticus TaxID=1587 RepID=UPI0001FF9435|nr:Conserved protein [Lactobacillus helveticus H10]
MIRMKKKKNETLKITWIMTAVYWVVGLLCMFWSKLDHVFSGQLKDINNVYALTLLIVLILPLLFSILLSMRVKPPRLICNPLVTVIYLLVVIAAGMAYNFQNIIGYFFPIILFVLMAFLAIFYASFKTFRNKKNGKYYFIDGKDREECRNFWDAYKQYYAMGLTSGIIEGLLSAVF